MAARAALVALIICCVSVGACLTLAAGTAVEGHAAAPDTPPAGGAAEEIATPRPATIRLWAAGRREVGGAPGFSLAVEVSNPNRKGALTFVGYKPDSFDPPIPAGRVAPLCKVELKRAGKWQAHPVGCCGTGLGAIPLAPRATAAFGAWVPAGGWEAVRVGLTWTTAPFEKAGERPGDFTGEWSNELTLKQARQAK
jgi:hypothetical protein